MGSDLPLVVQILHVPGVRVHIDEVEAAFASPSVLVDGEDATGASLRGACCRLDLPSCRQIRVALQRAMSARRRGSP